MVTTNLRLPYDPIYGLIRFWSGMNNSTLPSGVTFVVFECTTTSCTNAVESIAFFEEFVFSGQGGGGEQKRFNHLVKEEEHAP